MPILALLLAEVYLLTVILLVGLVARVASGRRLKTTPALVFLLGYICNVETETRSLARNGPRATA